MDDTLWNDDYYVFSILRKLRGGEILHSEFDFWDDWDSYKQFPIHARRWRVRDCIFTSF